jgi:hypothetical protein
MAKFLSLSVAQKLKRPLPKCTTKNPTWQEALCPLLHRLRAAHNHPRYLANGNEQTTLGELLETFPPTDGMSQYIADMDSGHCRLYSRSRRS